jgi:hypothetical protein
MHDFRKLAGETLNAPPVVAETPVVGTGSDATEFETLIPRDDAAALAAAIIAAGDARRGGRALAQKLSATAQGIVAAGARRRAEPDGFS